jgi:hypothetical protein
MLPSNPGRRSNRFAPVLLLPLAFLPARAGAESAEGALSVSVEVVESCRVAAPDGLGTELVPCSTARHRTAGARAASAPARGARSVPARTVVERGEDGTGYLTTIH